MKLSDYAIQELMPLVLGDSDSYKPCRSGSDLVRLFNQYGFRDVYDSNIGGLPKLMANQNMNTTRKNYVSNRLKQLNGKDEFRSLLTKILNEAANQLSFVKKLNEILEPESFHVESTDNEIIVQGGVIKHTPEVITEAKFKDIQARILAQLSKARVSIEVAVAWITNEVLINKLQEKKNEGIAVRILMTDDHTNRAYFPKIKDAEVYMKRGDGGGKMHHKFCVIDNQTVIHGSYNWSINAETKNDEDITVEENNLQLASDYSVQFRELVKDSTLFSRE
ncbi:MAG: phospholipase D-like domain-containing protein [Bacteroidales bacterium]